MVSVLVILLSILSSDAFPDDTNPYACPGGATYEVVLTFDDGPIPSRTTKVLDALKKHKVPGTFFVQGDKMDTKAA